jgi:hypothetical protein
MTTIIFLEQALPLQGVYDATPQLVDYHVHATQARFPWELQTRLEVGIPAKLATLAEPWDFPNYKHIIDTLDKTRPVWSVRDDRLLLCLDEFSKLVKEARLLWVDLERSRTAHEKKVQEMNREAFGKFKGPKLHLKKDDPIEALRFALGEEEKTPTGDRG